MLLSIFSLSSLRKKKGILEYLKVFLLSVRALSGDLSLDIQTTSLEVCNKDEKYFFGFVLFLEEP